MATAILVAVPPPTALIPIHADAPPKPAWGQPCNGCGVCCLVQPCPLGVVLSLRLHGACRMLQWSAVQRRYVCGALVRTQRWPLARRIVQRWMAAGQGCDCDIELEPLPEES